MQQLQKFALPLGALGIALIVGSFLLHIILNIGSDIVLLLAGIGVVLVAFYIITRPRDPERQSSGFRIASQGGNVILFGLAVIGVVIAINYIVDKQFPQRVDLTENKEHTLSQQTVQVLQSLQEPIRVIAFFTPQTAQLRADAEALLKDYQLRTIKLTVQYVDPDANPALAQKYDNAIPGTVIFEKGDRTEKVIQQYDENAFTNAILKVTQTQQPAIYFTTGHGEFSPADTGDSGFSAVEDYLKQTNYKVAELNPATISGTLPADTSAIVIAGPTTPFSPESDQVFKKYLESGGRILLMMNPSSSFGLTDTLKAGGIETANDLVLDPGLNYYGYLTIPLFQDFPQSPVTENMQGLAVFFPTVRSLKTIEGAETNATALFTTTKDACAKTDFEKLKTETDIQCNADDSKGPFVVGYAVEGAGAGGAAGDNRSRLVVLGNTSFSTNQWLNNPDAEGNRQMIRNMINWLAGQEELIAIPPRDTSVRSLSPLSENDTNLIFFTSVVLVPLAALVIGGLLWWRRR